MKGTTHLMADGMYQTAEGRWRVRYVDTAGKRHSKTFKKQSDAKHWLTEQKRDLLHGEHVAPADARTLFNDFIDEWWETTVHLRPGTRPTTVQCGRPALAASTAGSSSCRKTRTWCSTPTARPCGGPAPTSARSCASAPPPPPAAHAPSLVRNISEGDSGADVRVLQGRQSELGYGLGAIDGAFGPKTLAAVRRFRLDRGLGADGAVGPNTWSALWRLRGRVTVPKA